MYTSILFVAPKQGGILQSSGFLDLKSLIALSQTAKENVCDELSLVVLIENEITLYHGVQTKEEAITFLKVVFESLPLRDWLNHDNSTATVVTLSASVRYEVMFAKMLRSVPPSQRWKITLKKDEFGKSVLHHAAQSGKLESVKRVLAFYESQYLKAISTKDNFGRSVLTCAAQGGNHKTIEFLLTILSESQRLQVANLQDKDVKTVLHYAAESGSLESVKTILALYPLEQQIQVLNRTDRYQKTLLHYAAESENSELIKFMIQLWPESQRMLVVSRSDIFGRVALHYAAKSKHSASATQAFIELLTETQRKQVVCKRDYEGKTVFHWAVDSGNIETVNCILHSLPESARLQVVNTPDTYGETVLPLAREVIRESLASFGVVDENGPQ